jgi:hypothetical protein
VRFQFACGDLFFTDVEQQQCLNRVYFQNARAFTFIFDHIQQQSVQSFDQGHAVQTQAQRHGRIGYFKSG